MIKAVIWDLGGVIVRTMDTSFREEWEDRFNLQPGELHDIVFDGPTGRLASIGQVGPDEVWDSIAERFDLSQDECVNLQEDFWRGDRVDKHLVSFIDWIHHGYKSGLVSNAWLSLRNLIEVEWKIDYLFDDVLISAEVGVTKPDPAIYEQSLTNLDVNPENAIFVDDFKVNIHAAENLGMKTVWFQSTSQTIEAVESLLKTA
ncbi:MAG: HAD family hydrolase [Anaerolineales bacterium]